MAELGDIQKKLQDQLAQTSLKLAADFTTRLNQAWRETPEAKGGKALIDAVEQQLGISKKIKPKMGK